MRGAAFDYIYRACPRCGWLLGRSSERVKGRTVYHWNHRSKDNPCSKHLRALARKRAVANE